MLPCCDGNRELSRNLQGGFDVKSIPLTKGKTAIVDDDDYERVAKWKWCHVALGYAGRNITVEGRKHVIYLSLIHI